MAKKIVDLSVLGSQKRNRVLWAQCCCGG